MQRLRLIGELGYEVCELCWHCVVIIIGIPLIVFGHFLRHTGYHMVRLGFRIAGNKELGDIVEREMVTAAYNKLKEREANDARNA